MKQFLVGLLLGMFAVSGWAEDKKPEPYSPELVKKAEAGNAVAQYDLGSCYRLGNGVTKDEKEAVKWYTKSAVQGDADAQSNLGWCYANGTGVIKDEKEAVKWLTKSAEQGNDAAQYNLGWCYANGTGVIKDEKEAVKWLTKSAEQGYAVAQSKLGACYAQGRGAPQDYKEAVKWCTKSAEQGDARAQYNLSRLYYNGIGITKDEKEAVKWLTKAAEQGDAVAQRNLGACYATGRGATQDYKEAVKWLTKAAEQGDARAQFVLGVSYDEGNGVAQDHKEAVKWYTKSADQGDAMAQCNLGFCYARGRGATQDYKEAVKWLTKAAEQGIAEAQFNLGMFYLNGVGVSINADEALKWFQKGNAKGDANATYQLCRAYVTKSLREPEDAANLRNMAECDALLNNLLNIKLADGKTTELRLIGRSYLELGDFVKAKQTFEKAGALGGKFAANIEPEKMTYSSNYNDPTTRWVVAIQTAEGQTIGSGVFFGDDGWVITAAHVVAGQKELKVCDFQMATWNVEGVCPGDFGSDLAILKTSAKAHPSVPGLGFEPKMFEKIRCVGHPLGTIGLVSSSGTMFDTSHSFTSVQEVRMPALPGNSGGPVFNQNNELVGIMSEASFFIEEKKGDKSCESFFVNVSFLRKIIECAKDQKQFFPVDAISEWKGKNEYWDEQHKSNHDRAILGISKVAGIYQEKELEEGQALLLESARKGDLSAQIRLTDQKYNELKTVAPPSEQKNWKNEFFKLNPFYNPWLASLLETKAFKKICYLGYILILLLSCVTCWKCFKFYRSNQAPSNVRQSISVLGFLLSIIMLISCWIVLYAALQKNSAGIKTLIIYSVLFSVCYLLFWIQLNLVARGSRVALASGGVYIFFVSSFVCSERGGAMLAHASIAVWRNFIVIYALTSLPFVWIFLAHFSKTAVLFRNQKQSTKPIVPRDLIISLGLFVLAALYFIGLKASFLGHGGLRVVYDYLMFICFIGTTIIAIFWGLRWGDLLAVRALRLLLILLSFLITMAILGIIISGSPRIQMIVHLILVGLIYSSLFFSFSAQARAWTKELKPAY